MSQELTVDKKTGFRLGTRNLIVSGLEDELYAAQNKCRTTLFTPRRIDGIHDYADIPGLIDTSTTGSEVYLIQTDDPGGYGLTTGKTPPEKEWFAQFDTVLALTETVFDGEQKARGLLTVKNHGDYIGWFNEE